MKNQFRSRDMVIQASGSCCVGGLKMFAGYIFDVEGTLVDSVPQNLRSLQKALD